MLICIPTDVLANLVIMDLLKYENDTISTILLVFCVRVSNNFWVSWVRKQARELIQKMEFRLKMVIFHEYCWKYSKDTTILFSVLCHLSALYRDLILFYCRQDMQNLFYLIWLGCLLLFFVLLQNFNLSFAIYIVL